MVNNKFYGTGENISKQNIRYGAVTGKKPENFNYDYEIIVTSFDVKIGNSTNVSVNGNSIDKLRFSTNLSITKCQCFHSPYIHSYNRARFSDGYKSQYLGSLPGA